MSFIRFVLAWFGFAIRYAFTRGTGNERLERRGELLRELLIRLGPLYVKLGQILATRSDIVPVVVANRLRTLQDDVPSMSPKQLRGVLDAAFGSRFDSLFAEFSWQPVASASVAQVHEARLVTGERVAVKVVRAGVGQRLRRNRALLLGLLRAVHLLWPPVRRLSLPGRFRELGELLIGQANMSTEAVSHARMAKLFETHPYVRIPKLYPALCTPEVLVMDFVDATRGRDVKNVPFPAKQLARRLQDTIYSMLYQDGFCHADPHPGNLFFSDTGEIIFVDFGLVVELSEDEKWALASYYYACTRKEWQIAVRRLTTCFVAERGKIDERLEEYTREMIAVLKHHYEDQNTRWSTFDFFRDCNAVLLRYEASYTTSFAKVELVFVSCEGTAGLIDPTIDIWANARKFNDQFSPYMSAAVRSTFDTYFGGTMPDSIALEVRAKRSLVAPTHLDRYFVPSAYPLFVVSAKGSQLRDADGNTYVDLSCGYGPHVLGYAHPAIAAAIVKATEDGWINALGNHAEVELAEVLVEAFPAAELAVFSNSGTEAMIQAIRLCRAYRKRDVVAKFEGHYHGYSDLGMVSSYFRFSGPSDRPVPIQGSPGCHSATVRETLVLQYGHPETLQRIVEQADRLACVVCEPMPVAMANYDREFLLSLRALCTELDIPLVFDEVVTGFRVAYGGAQGLTGVSPDLTTLGKIIGGGLPCGAVVGRRDLVGLAKTTADPFTDFESRVFVGGTMSGNSISCAAGVAALRFLRDNPELYTGLDAATASLASLLTDSAKQHEVPFRLSARHSIFGMSFSYRRAKYHREKMASNFKANVGLAYYMRKHGVYMPELHTLMLSTAHTGEDLQTVGRAFDASLVEMVQDGFFAL